MFKPAIDNIQHESKNFANFVGPRKWLNVNQYLALGIQMI